MAANTFIFANDASSTLAGPISSTATAASLATGTGVLFPNPSANQQFAGTFNDAATGLLTEIVYCTARAGDTLTTIVRAQESTTALSWLAGDLFANLVTAGQMAAMLQSVTLQPVRTITTSGAFTTLTSDANGAVQLNRTSAPAASSTTLPSGATAGQLYAIEDLANNFHDYPVTVTYPAGTTGPGGAATAILNVDGQCAYFRLGATNVWSFKP